MAPVGKYSAPIDSFPDEYRARVREYLDQQARFDLALWVSTDRNFPDHELLLRARPRRPRFGSRLGLLWQEVSRELSIAPYIAIPTHRQITAAVKAGAEVVWHRAGPPPPGADPLDFWGQSEHLDVPRGFPEEIARAMSDYPDVTRVAVWRAKAFKGEVLLADFVCAAVECPPPGKVGDAVGRVSELLKAQWGSRGVNTGTQATHTERLRRGARSIVYRRPATRAAESSDETGR